MSERTSDEIDLVVIGGGISGMTVATVASQQGLAVAVIEISDELGGSAGLSEGYVWTAPDAKVFLEQDPTGDLNKFNLMLESLEDAYAWIEELGVEVGDLLRQVLGYGEGRQIDVDAFFNRTQRTVEKSGMVLLETEVTSLLEEGERVCGVEFRDRRTDSLGELRAKAVVLATGGFQGSEDLRDKLLFPGAGKLVLRSNPISEGAGILLGQKCGVDLTEPTKGFYGHLVPHPLKEFRPSEYALLAQYFSDHALLIDKSGRRFTDESLGDHINTNVIAQTGPCLLFVDERITREQVCRAFIPGMDAVNKMKEAGDRGANYFSSDSLQEISVKVSSWGYDGARFLDTIKNYNDSISRGSESNPPRTSHRVVLDQSPFAVLEVQAAITFTYRGLKSDEDGRAIAKGKVKPGLWVVGVDAGGLNQWGYTGGLVRGVSLGRRSGLVISAEIQSEGLA